MASGLVRAATSRTQASKRGWDVGAPSASGLDGRSIVVVMAWSPQVLDGTATCTIPCGISTRDSPRGWPDAARGPGRSGRAGSVDVNDARTYASTVMDERQVKHITPARTNWGKTDTGPDQGGPEGWGGTAQHRALRVAPRGGVPAPALRAVSDLARNPPPCARMS